MSYRQISNLDEVAFGIWEAPSPNTARLCTVDCRVPFSLDDECEIQFRPAPAEKAARRRASLHSIGVHSCVSQPMDYHARSRRFLVLNVWPDTEPAWLDGEALLAAMRHVDGESGQSRGWLHVERGAQP